MAARMSRQDTNCRNRDGSRAYDRSARTQGDLAEVEPELGGAVKLAAKAPTRRGIQNITF